MTTPKKSKYSVNLSQKAYDSLREARDEKGSPSVSLLITRLAKTFLKSLPHKNDDVTIVVLKIPNHLKEDSVKLQSWLDVRSNAIAGKLSRSQARRAI